MLLSVQGSGTGLKLTLRKLPADTYHNKVSALKQRCDYVLISSLCISILCYVSAGWHSSCVHDDVIKCFQTFSTLLAFCVGNSPVPEEFPAQRPVTWSFDVFSLICVWTNSWSNNEDAGDLRRRCAHYYRIVMSWRKPNTVYWKIRYPYCVLQNIDNQVCVKVYNFICGSGCSFSRNQTGWIPSFIDW